MVRTGASAYILRRSAALLLAATLVAGAGPIALASQGTAAARPGAASQPPAGTGRGYRVISFCDVNARTPHEAAIIELAALGVAGGVPGGTCGS